jgi:MoaA/NifB/PqqE/SkfB family radical SAM enzyme
MVMNNKDLTILNLNTACSCACKYCFFRSCKKANGIDYEYGKKIAHAFNKWRKEKSLNDFSLSYTIGYCSDYKQLKDNIELNKSFNFIGAPYLQINGIGLKTDEELTKYFKEIKDAGIKHIDTTFFGLPNFHNSFVSRENDFSHLINILEASNHFDINIQLTMAIFETNKDQIDELFFLLDKYVHSGNKASIFIQDYRGNGENLERIRLTKESYLALSERIKQSINISRYKTESEWLQLNEWSIYTNRDFRLSLTPKVIKTIDGKSCDEILDYLIELDEKYYSLFPTIQELGEQYGNFSNDKLYRERDLRWKWQKQFIKEHNIIVHDVTDERLCGSLRY